MFSEASHVEDQRTLDLIMSIPVGGSVHNEFAHEVFRESTLGWYITRTSLSCLLVHVYIKDVGCLLRGVFISFLISGKGVSG